MKMKCMKFLAAVIVPALCALWSCGNRTSENIPESSATAENSSEPVSEPVETVIVTDSETTEIPTETEPAETAPPVSVMQTETEMPSADESDDFSPEQSDDEVIAAAQYLFGEACLKEWNFTVGSPYELDTSQYITNEYGWQYYLVTEPDINSLADVMADYHKIFSEEYSDTLNELFIESEGHVYCLNGMRGSDIFFEQTVLSEIVSRNENEIVFTAESSYSDDGLGNGANVIEDVFAIVKGDNGTWRVSRFRLPY